MASPSSPAMRALSRPPTWVPAWLAACAWTAAALLFTVHALESWGGYPPCELCLHEREVVWTAFYAGLAGLAPAVAFPRAAWTRAWMRVAVVAAAVAFAVGAALAAYHAGVEWRWWPGPAACTGGRHGPVSAADVRAVLSGARTVHMVRCDEAAFRLAGLSLAGWNALLSAALAVASLAVLSRKDRP